MNTASIDLTKRVWSHERRGIVAIGTWLFDIEGRNRPCMVLIRAGEEYSEHTIPCVVTVDKAWIWSEEIGDPAEAARTAFSFTQALRLNEHDPREVIRLSMFINDMLGDLLTIPPYVPTARETVADVVVTDAATGRSHEREITIDV